MMRVGAALFFLTFLAFALPASASDRETLGFGRLFTNDAIGDGEDRWRSGAYAFSLMRGRPGQTALPDRLGALLEYRLRFEVIAASNTVRPAPGDRRYAGLISLGAHTHADLGGLQMSVGGDLVLVGPMTRLGQVQRKLHTILDQPQPDTSNQLPDAVYPTATVEVGRAIALGRAVEVRPFVEAATGAESFVRVGGDLRIGGAIAGSILVRDAVTGQRYRGAVSAGQQGFSFVVGADAARVFDSYLLPGAEGYVLTDRRTRVRAGVHWQGDTSAAFYGVTWMSEEFTAQPEPQAVGSLQLRLRF